jgi:GTP-binding protein HflX
VALIERSFREKIIVVGVILPGRTEDDVEAHLDELVQLIDTAGADVVGRTVQRRSAPDAATYVGKGKADEIRELSLAVDSDTVVFDDELSPAQQRNLEKIFGRTAITRTDVILDIFAQNAKTTEGKAQVELALLRHRLPRLRGRGIQLSRQQGAGGGGARIATRGPGETQLEVDRRRLVRRMQKLEADLKEVRKQRGVQRKQRRTSPLHTVSIVGYTNAGKSTLLNTLTDAGVLAEDRLFATLDPRTRRLQLPGGETVLLSDTVGFIRKLPTHLVEAFRSTLEEVAEADLLVHIVDGSAANAQEQIDAVHEVLREIDADSRPELIAINKADVAGPDAKNLLEAYPGSVLFSAVTGEGMDDFLNALSDRLRALDDVLELLVPFERGDVVAAAHREGEVLLESHEDAGTRLRVRVDDAGASRFREFVVAEA